MLVWRKFHKTPKEVEKYRHHVDIYSFRSQNTLSGLAGMDDTYRERTISSTMRSSLIEQY